MNFILDKSLFSFIIGPLVGMLVMSGRISPVCQNDVTQAYSLEIGAIIFVGSLLIGALHHHGLQEIKTQTPSIPAQPITETAIQKAP